MSTSEPRESPLMVRLDQEPDPMVISLDPQASFETLRDHLRRLLNEQPDTHGRHARLDVGSRSLDLFDLRRLLHMLKDELQIYVVGLRCTRGSVHRFAEHELKLKVHIIEEPALVDEPTDPGRPEPPVAAGEERIHVVRGTLRSGAQVKHGGDIVLYGDINPGAEVLASGNITVFGSLKGMAHAGARGNEQAFILALDIRPTQLRIASFIAIPPENRSRRPAQQHLAEVAYLAGDRIVIEPFRGRLPPTSHHSDLQTRRSTE